MACLSNLGIDFNREQTSSWAFGRYSIYSCNIRRCVCGHEPDRTNGACLMLVLVACINRYQFTPPTIRKKVFIVRVD